MRGIYICLLYSIFSILYRHGDCFGTMSIDLGAEFIKVAIVKSGVPMEIALDKESQRKTPTVVALKDGERYFGNPALNMAVKHPQYAYQYIPLLLAKNLDHPVVKTFRERFPYYKMSYNETSNQLLFQHDEKSSYSVEELLAMLLDNARTIAETHANDEIKAAVITVPPYFNQAERRAILRSAKLVDLDVHQLMNVNSAVALNFGVFRRKHINSTALYYMFVDVGSHQTTVTVAAYQTNRKKDSGIAKEDPEVTILGVGTDPELGVTEFIIRMRNYLADEFNKQNKNAFDVYKNNRAMGKLLKEAKRVVKILSANNDIHAQIEYLMNEKDFKTKVSRSVLEEMCDDIFNRLRKPINKALEDAQLPMPVIKEVILMGGGSRIPKIQSKLLEITEKSELGRSINTDEAAAMGAVYQSAYHSPGFRVLNFPVNDFNYYTIEASYRPPKEVVEDPKKAPKYKSNVLYKRGNPFPQKRVLSINGQKKDMDIYLKYSGLTEEQSTHIGQNWNLTHIDIQGVVNATKKHSDKEPEIKGVKVHFDLDYSGILKLNNVDLKMSYGGTENQTEENKPSTLGNKTGDNADGSETKPEEAGSGADSLNGTDTSASKNATKPTFISEPLLFEEVIISSKEPDEESMGLSKKKLEEVKEAERKLIALEKSRNDLESYLFSTRDRISSSDFIDHSSKEERQSISDLVDKTSIWYEDQGVDTNQEEYDKHLHEVQNLVAPVENRIAETNGREEAYGLLSKSLDAANFMADTLQKFTKVNSFDHFITGNLTNEFPMFKLDEHKEALNMLTSESVEKAIAQTEIEAFDKFNTEAKEWLDKIRTELKEKPKHEDPSIKITDIKKKEIEVLKKSVAMKETYESKMRYIQVELRKWIRTKHDESLAALKAVLEESKKNVTAADSNDTVTITGAPASAESSDSAEKTTARSDL